ncbi:MAG: APC family permease [Actinobacteria bacterium]|nr:APC family permease [Actinomycetota bacterium]
MILLNVANIGVVYVMFTYWAHPAVFPRSNLLVAIPVAAVLAVFFNLLYGMFAAIMPRTGSEYVYLTRTFHPVVGFMASFAAAMSQAFWVGIGGYWIAQFVLGPMMSSYGIISGNDTIASIGSWASEPTTWFWFGTAFVVLMAALNIFGLRAYLRFQDINWVIGAVTGVALLAILFTSSNETFQRNWNEYAAAAGVASYSETLQLAGDSGMPTGFSLAHLLGILPILWLVSWASTYIGGEVRTPARTQLRATVGGYLLYAGIAWVLMLALARPVTIGFNQAATWLSYNYGGDASVEFGPTFLLYTGLLVNSIPMFLIVGLGLVLWSYFWIPSAMIISTRAMFSWSFDRLMPEKLSEVHPRYNSPWVAVLTVSVIAEVFLILYHNAVFTFLTPALAYFFVFWLTSLAGVVFPYLRRTKALFEASPVNWRVGGIPVMTVCGVVGLFIWTVSIYYALTEDLLFLNGKSQLWTTFAQFAVPLVIFFVARAVRRSQGINVDAAFRELPPE